MEEGALTVTVFLTSLIIPISLGAAILGILTVVKGLGGFGGSRHREAGREPGAPRAGTSLLERAVAGLCGAVAVVLIVVLAVNMGRRGRSMSPLTMVLLVLILMLPAPAILWSTRYRTMAEGIATIAIAGIAILTGFSIGFLFVPLVVLMMWLCIGQLRQPKPPVEIDRSSG